ncbi:eCIS core domain-containing protein [Pandoraea anhela]|uniref:eCIS core domain-containing protein n=1 Tax=Pandoraea anhela TaxID=2508295 RepID=A0A5E4Z8M2_9BURK|nr:DUF4157 domain-containing protein [Pandoraea anhela]VVE57022.1 hypothetical protein PAN31108_05162 [Pandoraea anhela]
MNSLVNESRHDENQSIPDRTPQGKNGGSRAFQFVDNRPAAKQAAQLKAMMNDHALRQPLLIQKKENKTGLPDNLKSGIESLSSMSMDHVRVHYNSPQPAQLNAHAYAQGSEIHIAPGQERHLPHEAWHVVQQAQGRVKPTMQMKSGTPVNDDADLENEADLMGQKALQMRTGLPMLHKVVADSRGPVLQAKGERTAVLDTRTTTRSAGEAIRRGNRSNSITSTVGRSSAKLEITYPPPDQAFNTGYRNKIGELKAYVRDRMVAAGTHTRPQADQLLADNDTFVQAKAVEEISVGNCGEFAMVVYAHLIQNTDNQYIYRCQMAGNIPGTNPPKPYDHCFVMTSPNNMPVVPGVTDATGFDRTTTTIADAWDGYQVMTLAQFMNSGNAYHRQLADNNILINEAAPATGAQVLPPAVLGYIRDWAVTFNATFNNEMRNPASTYATVAAERARNPIGFGTNGSNVVGVDDKRTLAQKIGNSTPAERSDIIATATDAALFAYIDTLPLNAITAFLLGLPLLRANGYLVGLVPGRCGQVLATLPDDRIVSYLNTLAIQRRLQLLAQLPDNKIIHYINQCWNKGFFQRFALTSSFPYKADVIAALPDAQAYRLLQQLPEKERTNIRSSLPANDRNRIDAAAPPIQIVIA